MLLDWTHVCNTYTHGEVICSSCLFSFFLLVLAVSLLLPLPFSLFLFLFSNTLNSPFSTLLSCSFYYMHYAGNKVAFVYTHRHTHTYIYMCLYEHTAHIDFSFVALCYLFELRIAHTTKRRVAANDDDGRQRCSRVSNAWHPKPIAWDGSYYIYLALPIFPSRLRLSFCHSKPFSLRPSEHMKECAQDTHTNGSTNNRKDETA